LAGYTTFTGAYRERSMPTDDLAGEAFKHAQTQPGPWGDLHVICRERTIPKASNHVRLHETKKDQWGIPLLVMNVDYDEQRRAHDRGLAHPGLQKMLEARGVAMTSKPMTKVGRRDSTSTRWGGARRMGKDPQRSILNEWNQVHGCPNVFVTDGRVA